MTFRPIGLFTTSSSLRQRQPRTSSSCRRIIMIIFVVTAIMLLNDIKDLWIITQLGASAMLMVDALSSSSPRRLSSSSSSSTRCLLRDQQSKSGSSYSHLPMMVDLGKTKIRAKFGATMMTTGALSSTSSTTIHTQQQQRPVGVVVVGGGVGGLAVAARIASSCGPNVTITLLEKNNQVGGRCGSFWVQEDNINLLSSLSSDDDDSTISTTPTSTFIVHPKIPIPIITSSLDDADNDNDDTKHQRRRYYRHERGPSLLLLPNVYEEIFLDTTRRSKTAKDYGLDILPCIPAYQVIFDDGDMISIGFPKATDNNSNDVTNSTPIIDDEQQQQQQKMTEFESRAKMDTYETDGAAKWDEYMAITSAYLDCGLPNFIEERFDPQSFPNFVYQSIRGYGKAWPLKPHSDVLDTLFVSNKLKALASFQDLYVGLEPYRNNQLVAGGVFRSTAPAVFGLLAAIELHPTNKKSGVFAPKGGFQSMTNALEKLVTDLGVEIRCGTTVTRISNHGMNVREAADPVDDDESNGSKTKPNTTTKFLPADLIIVNADLPYAKSSLIDIDGQTNDVHNNLENRPISTPIEMFDWDDGFSFSSGVISFHWSIDKALDNLITHNVFMVANSRSQAEASWQVLRRRQEDDVDGSSVGPDSDKSFNFYVHRPAKTDPSAAPPGCDSIMVLVPCRTLLRDDDCARLSRDEAMGIYKEQFSEKVVSDVRTAVLKRMAAVGSLQDLEQHIVHEVVDTPATWADQYHLAAGTPFGLSHGFAQLSVFRPGPKSSGLSNVLYCGASTKPGNGVPLVLVGAKQVAEIAVARLQQIMQ